MVQSRQRLSRPASRRHGYKFLASECGTGMIRGEEPIAGPELRRLVQYRRNTKHELNKIIGAKSSISRTRISPEQR